MFGGGVFQAFYKIFNEMGGAHHKLTDKSRFSLFLADTENGRIWIKSYAIFAFYLGLPIFFGYNSLIITLQKGDR